MSLHKDEFHIIRSWRDQLPAGNRIAILGDCNFDYKPGANIKTFGDDLGFLVVNTFDVNGSPTINLDLNRPITSDQVGKYDWVLDAGTCYCCFSPGNVFENMHRMLDSSGVIVSWSALFGFTNRGFYTFHPALYVDMFNANGYEILRSYYRLKTSGWHPLDDISMFNGDTSVPNDTLIMYVAKRKEYKPFVMPIPTHYIRTGGK